MSSSKSSRSARGGSTEPLMGGGAGSSSSQFRRRSSTTSRRKKPKEITGNMMHTITSKRGSQLWKDASYNNEEQFTCLRYTACVSSESAVVLPMLDSV